MKLLVVTSVAVLLAACAGTPPQSPVTTTTLAPATAPVAMAGGPAAPDSAAQAHQKLLSDARTQGYTTTTVGGATKYCRSDIGTGTHIPHMNCYSEDQLAEQLRIEAANREEWARAHGNCGGVNCATK